MSLKNLNWGNSSCRRAVFLAQAEMGRNLQHLLALNPEIRRWRRQRRLVEIKIKAAKLAIQPKLVALLMVERAAIIARQVQLRQSQQSLLWQSRSERALAEKKFHSRAHKLNPIRVSTKSKVSDLAVHFVPTAGLGAETIPRPNFQIEQRLVLSWQAELLREIPRDWLKPLNLPPLTVSGACAATLSPEGRKWKAQLSAAKF